MKALWFFQSIAIFLFSFLVLMIFNESYKNSLSDIIVIGINLGTYVACFLFSTFLFKLFKVEFGRAFGVPYGVRMISANGESVSDHANVPLAYWECAVPGALLKVDFEANTFMVQVKGAKVTVKKNEKTRTETYKIYSKVYALSEFQINISDETFTVLHAAPQRGTIMVEGHTIEVYLQNFRPDKQKSGRFLASLLFFSEVVVDHDLPNAPSTTKYLASNDHEIVSMMAIDGKYLPFMDTTMVRNEIKRRQQLATS